MNLDVFEHYPVPRAVASFAIPSILTSLVTVFYNMADTFFVGQTGDPNQVAAVSLATPVFLLLLACGNIFGIGGSSFLSRALGEGNREKVKKISCFCFFSCILVGLLMMFLFLGAMPVILKMAGSSPNTEGFAKEYLSRCAYGAVFVVPSVALGNIVRAEGAIKTSMFGMMLGTVVNIILDPIMILWMGMGVKGAAWATVIGNISSVVFYLGYIIFSRRTLLSVNPKYFSVREGILFGVLVIGIPAFLNNLLMSTSNVLMNNFLVKYGDVSVAAMGVAMKANMLVIFLQLGIAMGLQPLIGYCYGAKNYSRLKSVMKFSMICSVIIGSTLTVLYLIFSKEIVGVFIQNEDVIIYGEKMLRALMLSSSVIGIMFVFTFSFQAMGKAVSSLVLSVSRQGLIFFPVLILGNMFFGLNGIIFAQPIADLGCLLTAIIMFIHLSHQWKKENIG